ncbi:MAG: GntR family transcriptional regulator [Clostridioides sp.]|nr:GntR family transcriptional regulator [Clostridioides sp.]
MNIIINNSSSVPLYEQIKNQIKDEIIKSNLKPDDVLPSIRSLAKDLKVSIITTKRAYEELEKDGFIYTVTGKGSFIAEQNQERLREIMLSEIECKLEQIIKQSKSLGVGVKEFIEIVELLYKEKD